MYPTKIVIMRLYEFEGTELFRREGIPVPNYALATSPEEAREKAIRDYEAALEKARQEVAEARKAREKAKQEAEETKKAREAEKQAGKQAKREAKEKDRRGNRV